MKNMSDIVGTIVFPFQTEIAFIVAIFTTAQRLVVCAWGHICQKQYWSAWLCVLLLVVYVGLTAAVIWIAMPLLKTLIVSKLAISAYWAWPVRRLLLWGIDKMVAAICRKFSLDN
ncbi:TPA: abortive infection protein [Klebsiella pneumoniae]